MNNPAPLRMKSIVLLGASFTTGNLGVSALAWSSIKIIKTRWPDARIVLAGSGRQPGVATILLDGRQQEFSTWPVRYCPNVLERNHIVGLGLAVFFSHFLPFLKTWLSSTTSTLGELLSCDLVCDITGGDSFSDIYGFSRFFRGFLLKRICQMTDKPFVLLPQTYGPFTLMPSKILARQVLKHAQSIFSRDREGLAVIQGLIGTSDNVRLCPDVAFIMETRRPESLLTNRIERLKAEGNRLIGLNISGLLYNGGYTRNNMFGLACDYPSLVMDIISYFTRQPDQLVLLVPHVVPPAFPVEDDIAAARDAVRTLPADILDKVIILDEMLDQNETKYCIGLCDFFLGARMHATIAALSQKVPAVGMAYSRKFAGVFETAGVADCVLDLRVLTNEKIMNGIKDIFARREEFRVELENTVPNLHHDLFHLFDGLNGVLENGE